MHIDDVPLVKYDASMGQLVEGTKIVIYKETLKEGKILFPRHSNMDPCHEVPEEDFTSMTLAQRVDMAYLQTWISDNGVFFGFS